MQNRNADRDCSVVPSVGSSLDEELDPIRELRLIVWKALSDELPRVVQSSLPLPARLRKSRQHEHGDFSLLRTSRQEGPVLSSNVVEKQSLLSAVKAASSQVPYTNIWLSRDEVLRLYVPQIVIRGKRYGANIGLAGMDVIVSYKEEECGSTIQEFHKSLICYRRELVAKLIERLAEFSGARNIIVNSKQGLQTDMNIMLANNIKAQGELSCTSIAICGIKLHWAPEDNVASVLEELKNSQMDMGFSEGDAMAIAKSELSYGLLRPKCGTKAAIDVQRMKAGGEDSPGAVILYNRSRMDGIEDELKKVEAVGKPEWSSLLHHDWELFWNCIAPFPGVVKDALYPKTAHNTRDPTMSLNQSFHSVAEFTFRIAKFWSRYYSKARIAVPSSPGLMSARMELLTAFRLVFDSCLYLLGMQRPRTM